MSADSRRFGTVVGQYPTGICVITGRTGEGENLGMTVGSFASVSRDPPLVAFFPDRKSRAWLRICDPGRFCVDVLADDRSALSRHFAPSAKTKVEGVR